MRWATFTTSADPSWQRAGVLADDGGSLLALPAGTTIIDLLREGGRDRLLEAGERAEQAPAEVIELAEATLLSPIPEPPTVRDFYAFEQHVKTARQRRGLDMDPDWYELPVFYFSNPYAVNGPDEDVAVPPGSSELDFELEVGVVVGTAGSDLDPTEAEAHIAGFTIMNDWSARDLQRREMKLSMGPVKGKDFATTLGPWLVTPDELEDVRKGQAYDLAMKARVNGVEYSSASLADVHFSFGQMLAYASRGTKVGPGDVIGSGTCGTGCILELSLVHGAEAYPWLKPGDVVELEIERLGTLRNRVVAGPGDPKPLR